MNQAKFDDNNRQQSRDDEVVAENVDDENTVIETKTRNNNLSKNFFILFEQIITQNQRSGSIDATPANTPVIVKSRKIFINNNNDQSDTTTSKVSIINKDDGLQFRKGDNVKNEENARQEESSSSNTFILKPSIIANFEANRDRWNTIAKRRTPMGLHPGTKSKSLDLLQSNSKSKSFCNHSIPKSTAEDTHDEESTAASTSTKRTSSTSCSSNDDDDISGLLYTELDDDESQDYVHQEKKETQEEQTNPSQWVEFEKNSFLPPKEEQEHCQKNIEYTDCLPEKEKIDTTMGDHELLENPQHDLKDTQLNYLCCCFSDFPQFSFLVGGDSNKKYNKLHVPKNETI